jgi:predicted  nucleic acid-binding Zn ribbon protein
METAAIHFRLDKRVHRDRALEALQGYIGALWRNGQLLGSQTPIAHTRAGYSVFANLPAADSLDRRHANRHVRRYLRALAGIGFKAPKVQRLGSDPEGIPPCRCRRRPFLILFTTFLHEDSPVRCGACFHPIPLYVFPATGDGGDHHYILRWQSTYQATDWLWIGSGAGERFGHDQMARHDSPLSKDGCDEAKTLALKARRPVYYYLSKSLARSYRQERARKCPSCGRRWLLDKPLHDIFDFKCDSCRLLSNIAWDVRR